MLGLIQTWGKRHCLSRHPGFTGAILVTTSGLMFVRLVLLGHADVIVPSLDINSSKNWATLAPELL